MQIHITSGTGTGPTTLAAFDAALNTNGIANYNLLRLSSVIPPQTDITIQPMGIPHEIMPGKWGDRLYVVMAEQRTAEPGQEVWAGIGWVQDKESKKGLFVEHEGTSEADVRNDIEASLKALMKTRGIDFGEIYMVVKGAKCVDEPICAMAVAAYQSSNWNNQPDFIKG
jgi:arginine decarboxylase